MQTWQQVYAPIAGSLGLSALAALIPIVFFFLALAVFRMKGHFAATITLALSMIVAVVGFGMPTNMAFASAGYGFLYGLWPIAWIIVASVFLYKLTVKSGQFGIIRNSIISITEDQRIQVVLIGFAFGAFLEGAAGFGAPVAITAAILVGLGFNPIYAAGLCLIANTAPVAFGALGIPILVAGKVTNIDPFVVGAMAGRQLPFLSIIIPLWIVAMMDGWRGVKEVWPAALVAGGSFAISQYLTSNFIGPELPDVTSAIASIVLTTLFLKVWKPADEPAAQAEKPADTPPPGTAPWKAWLPWIYPPFPALLAVPFAALPVAAALQLGKGFKVTMLAAMVLSFIAIITGLVTSYWLGAAPGGVTALVSVALLLLIIIYKEIRAVL